MRGATARLVHARQVSLAISIHAPHAGRDGKSMNLTAARELFQSTRPMRGATAVVCVQEPLTLISIHAPHAGRDSAQRLLAVVMLPISIHAPHAGRDH